MEKYEINKFINEYEKRINDLYQALKIEDKIKEEKELKEKSSEGDFWNNPNEAKKVISRLNIVSSDISSYNDLKSSLNDIIELNNEASTEEELALLEDLIKELTLKEQEVSDKTLLSGKYDDYDALLELHPGAGGTESMDWALMLFRMYQRFSNKEGFKFEILNYEDGDEAGIKSCEVLIKGHFAYGLLKAENGVHRLVRISPFDAGKRRHTSFVSCSITPYVESLSDEDIKINDEDIRIDTYLSSGHGGQGVNTTYSAVRVTHIPTGIVVTCQNERSQLQNKEICLRILRSKLLAIEIKKSNDEIKKITGEDMAINFGSQIRSYVFTPYTLVKDHRTNYEVGNVNDVMDGNIKNFMIEYLKYLKG